MATTAATKPPTAPTQRQSWSTKLLPDPPKDHPLFRLIRKFPKKKHDAVGYFIHTHFCKVDSIDYAITAHIQVKKSQSFKCCDTFYADMFVIETGKEEVRLGHVLARSVRTTQPDDTANGEKLWKPEVLTPLKDYNGDVSLHGGANDKMSDMQKVFQHLYDPEGEPKDSLAQEFKDLLEDQPELYYIEEFILNPEHRKKHLGDQHMLAFLAAMTKANGDCPVVLSPAPLLAETLLIRQAKGAAGRWTVNAEKIQNFYTKTDFKTAHQGSKRKAGTITVMVRGSSKVATTKPVAEKPEKGQVPLPKSTATNLSKATGTEDVHMRDAEEPRHRDDFLLALCEKVLLTVAARILEAMDTGENTTTVDGTERQQDADEMDVDV